ncbi:MAG: M23 family metallopeptidase [Desulfobulbaceae bacterium]|jgi:murein DD-endopeptidase MepM/ murein hydrolase activator NlpD|nr:M23 family metallopeptidase [Desulfobulbaceae bacterium]
MAFPSMQKNQKPQAKRGLSSSSAVAAAVLVLVVLGLFFLFFELEKPSLVVENGDGIARNDTIVVAVKDEKSGIRRVKIEAIQGSLKKELLVKEYPRDGYTGRIGPASDRLEALFSAENFGFKEGDIELVVTANDYSLGGLLGGNSAATRKTVRLDSKPPVITQLFNKPFITPGGSALAAYSLNEPVKEQGVLLGDRFFPGAPLQGSKNTYVCYFALPYDAEKLEQAVVRATDLAGNVANSGLAMRFKAVKWKEDKIPVSDNFLAMKLPEFEQHYPEMRGEPLEKYKYINGEVRRANEKQIDELCANSDEQRLWRGAFLRMPGSARAGFADHRGYVYNGEEFDRQVHLGMDIASLAHAQVRAANAGKVVFADYLGIYGNMVLIDHGQGLFSLYSHMSQINVAAGDAVTPQTALGLTGATGMAGGDHLHFSMLVRGVFVTPIEWWDPHWIKVNIDEPLAGVGGAGGAR